MNIWMPLGKEVEGEDNQPAPVYEVVEEHQVDKLEMKENIAYGAVSH